MISSLDRLEYITQSCNHLYIIAFELCSIFISFLFLHIHKWKHALNILWHAHSKIKLVFNFLMKQKWYLAAIFILSLFSIRCGHLGLPWWCSGQTVKQRSLCATTSKPGSCNYRSLHGLGPRSDDWWISVPQQPKPVHPEPVVYSKRSHPSERPRHHNAEEPLLSTTRATKTQYSQKQINVYFLKCGHLTFQKKFFYLQQHVEW